MGRVRLTESGRLEEWMRRVSLRIEMRWCLVVVAVAVAADAANSSVKGHDFVLEC